MLQLRHLEVIPICLLDPLPVKRLDQTDDLVLINLHTLMKIENFRLSEEVCKRIPNISTLCLSYWDEAMSDYYCPHNLVNFQKLDFLICQFEHNFKWRDFAFSLTLPASLRELHLSGCGVDWEELTKMVGPLPNLISLCLHPHSVIGSVWTLVEGQFLSLKSLMIDGCNDLVYWNADYIYFPVLCSLRLKCLSKLDELPFGIGEIPTLESIEMEYCSESATISGIRILVEQEELGNGALQLRVSFQGDGETLENFNNKVREEGLTSSNIFLHLKHVHPQSL